MELLLRGWNAALEFARQPLREVDEEHRAFLASPESRRFDVETAGVLVSVAALLTWRYYGFSHGTGVSLETLVEWLRALAGWLPAGGDALRSGVEFCWSTDNRLLAHWCYWSLGQDIAYVVAPAALIRLVYRRPLRDYGLKLAGWQRCWWVYALMYLGLLPFVLLVAQRESFLHYYPFYRPGPNAPLWPRMVVWELWYALQFVTLEFFFRGYMLHGLRRRFGAYAIFVMTVPYCMIHFGKPWPETVGSIIAGVLLGFMSLKTRSIWLGAALHIAVAWTMDGAALWQQARAAP